MTLLRRSNMLIVYSLIHFGSVGAACSDPTSRSAERIAFPRRYKHIALTEQRTHILQRITVVSFSSPT